MTNTENTTEVQCGECGTLIVIEKDNEGLFWANGDAPIDHDAHALIFHPYHKNDQGGECDATLIVMRGDLP